MSQFKEIFLRRNLFVHNDGIVNKRYLDSSKDTKHSIGDTINISDDYIITSMEVLKMVAVSICFMGWNHLKGLNDSKFMCSDLSDIGYDALKTKEWYLAERTYELMSMYGDDEDKLLCKINKIICLRNTNRESEATEILEGVNYSMYNSRYIIGFAALKGDIDTFIQHLDASNTSLGDLLDWPILEKIKDQDKFKQLLKDRLLSEAIAIAKEDKLHTLQRSELFKIAKSQGLKFSPSISKANVIQSILDHQKTILTD